MWGPCSPARQLNESYPHPILSLSTDLFIVVCILVIPSHVYRYYQTAYLFMSLNADKLEVWADKQRRCTIESIGLIRDSGTYFRFITQI
jgi:hypothetical protein